MELALLQTLVAVVEEGGFAAAADRLCITPSAVSRRIQQLEERFGQPLLDRSAEPVHPTPAGRKLLPRARRILEIEAQLERDVARLKGRERVSFGCTPCFGAGLLPAIMERHLEAAESPFDLSVSYRMPEAIIPEVMSGHLQFGVVDHCDALTLPADGTYHLPAAEVVFATAPSLDLSTGSVALADLARHRLILKAENGCAHRFLRRQLAASGESTDTFRAITYYDDLAAVVRQVVHGHGIGFLCRELIEAEVAAGTLRIHHLPGLNHRRPRSLLVSPTLDPSPPLRRFLGLFFSTLGQEPPPPFQITLPPGAAGGRHQHKRDRHP